jgi:2,3-bisphosphoglycerate-independent phosphoglycerate mutase
MANALPLARQAGYQPDRTKETLCKPGEAHVPSKCLLIVLDGLGDRSYARFGHLTPLASARTPALDALAARGASGLYHAGSLGQALPSENAHFAMFGYELCDFPGRGALEALGSGVELAPGEVAVLAHFVSLENVDGRARLVQDLPRADAAEAKACIAAAGTFAHDGVQVRFHQTKGLFGVLVLSGGALDPRVTDSNPMRDGRFLSAVVPRAEAAADPATRRTAAALTAYLRFAHQALSCLPENAARTARGLAPLNGLVSQRAGRLKPVTPFARRFGLKGASLASGAVFKGLAAYLGLDFVRARETGDAEADMFERLHLARELLSGDVGFLHLHTKAPDEAAHTKDPVAKLAVIEALDRALARGLAPFLDDPEVLTVVTADHSTPSCGQLVHSGEPVPLTLCGPGVRRDGLSRFDEVTAAAGALGPVRGTELMALILNALDRCRLAGIHDTPESLDYWPGDFDPFRL